MLRVFEAEAIANHRDGQRLVVKKLFGINKNMVGNDILGGTAGFHTHQIPEISAGQAAFVCKISYRR